MAQNKSSTTTRGTALTDQHSCLYLLDPPFLIAHVQIVRIQYVLDAHYKYN